MNHKKSYRYFSSWDYCEKDFESALQQLKAERSALCRQDRILSDNNAKYVWRIPLTGDNGQEFDTGYKICSAETPWRYMFRYSLPTREAENYRLFASIGMPMPRLLAHGDTRKCFILKESYIVVEFIPGTKDGTVFMPDRKMRDDTAAADEFTKKNFELLAKLHQNRIFHKAFHVRNSLFRYDENGNMEIFWIDVARCRRYPWKNMKWPILFDLQTWLQDLRIDEVTGRRYIEYYCSAWQNDCPRTSEALMDQLRHFKRRASSAPRNVFC
jgi:tRNA A-37 threonylcarbamoyl transferase component Bud32